MLEKGILGRGSGMCWGTDVGMQELVGNLFYEENEWQSGGSWGQVSPAGHAEAYQAGLYLLSSRRSKGVMWSDLVQTCKRCLLSAYYVPAIWDKSVNKIDLKIPFPVEVIF